MILRREMKTIWKYQIKESEVTLSIPIGGKILAVQMQGFFPCIWALVDSANKKEDRQFVVIGTGEDFDDRDKSYIGTFQESGGALIWHLFERIVND